ncbi:toxic anion resistance protein [Caldibacillus lycopersici]|uniref:Toxic anion resistance protein n=1 Tax=Perspicuibacillus lycopersici TaxID=1325689 RepID=A0AAE3IXF7_9BACI|nr:toxic anion resistance protein [Perspicuibacillus lycopersici]MCU9615141.1 toxic anion resistance protein [Perspicuibacillus lycopersici]
MSNQNETKASTELDEMLANPFGSQDMILQSNPVVDNKEKSRKLMDTLPEEGRKRAIQLATQIDPYNQQSIVLYGTEAQAKLTNFSSSMLEHVKNKSVGEIGEILTDLMKKLEQVNPEELQPEKRGLLSRMFGKVSKSINEILSKYQKTGAQIDRITVKLDHCKNTLMSDNKLLEQLYEKNKDYFQALNIYIAAGELKLEELQTKTIPALQRKAEETQDQMVFQEVSDMVQFAERLEKRVHDLKLSRQITIQSAPQIRLIQNTNQQLVEKIQSSIMTAIPLWKNQIAIALTLIRQRNAVAAQKQVSQTTNDLLLRNAEMLKTNTIETAKENERGLVDIETLKKTQENLITTLEETLRIQAEGRAKRYQAEQELITMEDQLKEKLLDIRR